MGMTREKVKELLPIMQAFADGKEIQMRRLDGMWIDCDLPTMAFGNSGDCYRVKPELQWRPFKLQEYLDGYADFYSKRLVKRKNNPDAVYAITKALLSGVEISGTSFATWEALTNNFTWHDGTEIGIRE